VTPCSPGGAGHSGFGLIDQIEAAGKNVLLVVPELARDANTGNPGRFVEPGRFRSFLNELITGKLAPFLGGSLKQWSDINRLIVFAHSAGGWAAAAMIKTGGVEPILREMHILDGSYNPDNVTTIGKWITANANGFETGPGKYKYSNIYFGTADLSKKQVQMVQTTAVFKDTLRFKFDPTTAPPKDQSLYRFPVLFKNSHIADHNLLVTKYIAPLLANSPI